MQYEIHTRSQHSKGSSSNTFGGPDTYVAVTIAPDGVVVPKVLNRKLLASRGIKIKYFGEGYAKHSGPRSMLGRAIKAAENYIIEQEKKNAC